MTLITRDECMRFVLKRIPGFHERWQTYSDFWGDEEAGICNDMAEFSNYVSDLLADGEHGELQEIFSLIEYLMTEGDQEVKDATATCFLENLQNRASSGVVSAKNFVHLLGPEARAYCRAWDEFTGVQTPGL